MNKKFCIVLFTLFSLAFSLAQTSYAQSVPDNTITAYTAQGITVQWDAQDSTYAYDDPNTLPDKIKANYQWEMVVENNLKLLNGISYQKRVMLGSDEKIIPEFYLGSRLNMVNGAILKKHSADGSIMLNEKERN